MTSQRWLACLLILLTSHTMAAERGWRTVTTPHYRVVSQQDDRDTAMWMKDFDQFILSTTDVLQMDLKAMPPLTVVLFKDDKDYSPYKLLLPNGQTANVAGQFSRRPTWSMIGMAYRASDEYQRRVIFHEATHWLMSADQARQPAWFVEGIAELFSTFERNVSTVNWAKPIGQHLQLLYDVREMPLREFLAQPRAIFEREAHTARFYAQAWAFTHFLMFSNEGQRRPKLLEFLRLYKTQSPEATIDAVFGSTLAEVQRDFDGYVSRRSYHYMKQPVKAAAESPPLQPARPAEVEAALGFLAMAAGRSELAKQHADKAIALEKDARYGHELLAYIAASNREFNQATRHAEEALQRGSKDSDLFMLLGDSYANGANSGSPDAKRMRVAMYENAINLNPRRLAVYERLTEALIALDEPREEDAKFLGLGLRAFPGEDWLRVGSASVDHRLGRREAAATTMEAVLRAGSSLDASQRTYAEGLRRRWLLDEMRTEMEAATNKRDFTAARATIDRYRDRLKGDAEAESFLKSLDANLELGELMARYQDAQRSQRKSEERALAEQLLAREDLPKDFRSYLEGRMGARK